MAINTDELVLTARDLITELPESVIFSRENLFSLIKPAISLWQDQTNSDPQKRQNFIVESGLIFIASGIADLSSEIGLKGFRVEFIKDSDVTLSIAGVAPQVPQLNVKFVNSVNRLAIVGRQDRFFHLVHLSGSRMTIRAAGSPSIAATNGTLTLRAPVIPSDLTTLNKPVMYEIAILLADLAKQQYKEQNRGLDIPVK